MALTGVVEFALHLDNFKNIDLFQAGLYNVQFRIYHMQKGEKIFAVPYQYKDQTIRKRKDLKPSIKPNILQETNCYVSKTFQIRFCDEEVDINEIVNFRTEYEAFPEYIETEFFLEADLMYCDITQVNGSSSDSSLYPYFKSVSSLKYRITKAYKGINEYLPVLFDDQHFCIMHSVLHVGLLDFQFKAKKSESDKKARVAKNFTEFLALTTQFSIDELQNFYEKYTKALNTSYQTLVEHYAYLLRLCYTENPSDSLDQFLKNMPERDFIEDYVLAGKHSTNEHDHEEKKVPERPQNLFQNFKEKPLMEVTDSKAPTSIATAILKKLNSISGKLTQIWYLLAEMLLQCPRLIVRVFREEHDNNLRARWNESFLQKVYKGADLIYAIDSKIGENHLQIANTKRNSLFYKNLTSKNSVEDLDMFPDAETHPIAFEEVFIKDDMLKQTDSVIKGLENVYQQTDYAGAHLIVLCHGFQGNAYDMRLLKNNISILYPETIFLLSTANEDHTDGDISDMGLRLAGEVINYIQEWIPGNNLGRLSFIGHSLGGLIIRAALPYLEDYSSKMHLYMSLSSAHLGYMYHSNKIVESGMWLLRKWKKSKCLLELSMTDAEKLESCYLFKLSKTEGLSWFKNVVLLSSHQDSYAPFDSARIQTSKKIAQDSEGSLFAKMAQNLLENIKDTRIFRIDINFNITQNNIDAVIGRAAHIQFLENQALMRMLVYRYSNFFS